MIRLALIFCMLLPHFDSTMHDALNFPGRIAAGFALCLMVAVIYNISNN